MAGALLDLGLPSVQNSSVSVARIWASFPYREAKFFMMDICPTAVMAFGASAPWWRYGATRNIRANRPGQAIRRATSRAVRAPSE